MNAIRMTAGFLVMACVGVAQAQTIDFTLNAASSATIQTDAVLDTTGTLIGDYDAKSNPEGTLTQPGFFGGSGNNAIGASADLLINAGDTTQPAGGLQVTLSVDSMSGSIAGLTLDLLNGSPLSADLTASLVYDTFHTVAPAMIYPGGIELPIPLGQLGTLRTAMMSQADTAIAVVSAHEIPGVFDVSALVPIELYLEVEVTLMGGEPTVTPIGPIPAVLPFDGQVFFIGEESIELSVSLGPLEDSQEIPIGPIELPAVPLELPTLGSETAGVLLTMTADSLFIDTILDVSIHADGVEQDCEADRNGDGILDFFDVSDFLNDFSALDPTADMNSDTQFDFFDVLLYLASFSAGCP